MPPLSKQEEYMGQPKKQVATAVMEAPEMETPAIKVEMTPRERDMKMVKGRFRCFEPQGGNVRLAYRKHKGEPVRTYTMEDGEIYEIPFGLATYLRDQCCYYEHGHIMDKNGAPLIDRRNKRIDRMTFEPVGFSFDGELHS